MEAGDPTVVFTVPGLATTLASSRRRFKKPVTGYVGFAGQQRWPNASLFLRSLLSLAASSLKLVIHIKRLMQRCWCCRQCRCSRCFNDEEEANDDPVLPPFERIPSLTSANSHTAAESNAFAASTSLRRTSRKFKAPAAADSPVRAVPPEQQSAP